jgi:hypothetical protein
LAFVKRNPITKAQFCIFALFEKTSLFSLMEVIGVFCNVIIFLACDKAFSCCQTPINQGINTHDVIMHNLVNKIPANLSYAIATHSNSYNNYKFEFEKPISKYNSTCLKVPRENIVTIKHGEVYAMIFLDNFLKFLELSIFVVIDGT